MNTTCEHEEVRPFQDLRPGGEGGTIWLCTACDLEFAPVRRGTITLSKQDPIFGRREPS